MPRSTEALVEPDILRWARDTAGLSVDEAAHSLQTRPERVQAWEDGEEHPSMAQLRRMATTYRRLLSDFYLPRRPEDDPLPHDFRRLPGEVAFRYSKALRYQLRLARERRALALDFAAELDTEIPLLAGRLQFNADTERPERSCANAGRDARHATHVARPARELQWLASAIERAGMLVFPGRGRRAARNAGLFASRPTTAGHRREPQARPERAHLHAAA